MKKHDIFISYKNLDDNGTPTRDSLIAEELYYFFTKKKLDVFFSNINLEQLGIAAYKKAIDDALDSSKVLIAVGTRVDYLESKWVRYEWDSFCNDILSGINQEGRIFTVVDNIKISQIPRALRQNQVFLYSEEAFNSLYNFISNALRKENNSLENEANLVSNNAEMLLQQKAKSKGFVMTKIGSETRLSKSGTLYRHAFFDVDDYKNVGTLYCHTSGEKTNKVFFVWRGINWYYQEVMKGAQHSFLGLPVSDEYVVQDKSPFISRSDFENGYIEYNDRYNELNIFKKEKTGFSLMANHKF